MKTRTKKIQSRYKSSGYIGNRINRIIPTLELSGNWFAEAGFKPGQQVSIVCELGMVYIKPLN